MYAIFMVTSLLVLAVAWAAYLLWQRRQDRLEQSQPKQASQHLQKSRSEVADWAQKMASFKPPKRPSGSTGDQGETPSS